MTVYVWAFVVALVITFAITPLIKRLAINIGAMDKPDARKVHHGSIPRLGGLAIFIGYIISVLYTVKDLQAVMGLLLGSVVLVGVGIWDDVKQIGPKTKLTGQILAAVVVVAFGNQVEFITNPWGHVFYLGFLSIPLTIFWIVGFTLGFLRYNFNPAKIFMGDTGSMLLGYTMATISVMGAVKTAAAISLVVPVIVLGLPILDTTFAIIRRKINGRPVFKPDKGHMHHRLLALGLSQKQAVLLMYAVTALLGYVAILLAKVNILVGIFIVLAILCVCVFIATKLGMIAKDEVIAEENRAANRH